MFILKKLMSNSSTKKIFQEFIDEVWNKNSTESIDKYIAADCVVHLLGSNKDGVGINWVKNNIITSHQKYPSLTISVEDIVVEGNKISSMLQLASTIGDKKRTCRELILYRI